MKRLGRQGFTLIEVIVVAAIIAILAGILVPMIFNQIDESKKARALADTKSLQTALMMFQKDTGIFPYNVAPNAPNVTMLVTGDPALLAGDAGQLSALGYDPSTQQNIKDHLMDAATAKVIYADKKWNGPYLTSLPVDPWNKPYMIPVGLLNPSFQDPNNPGQPYTGPVWILSAGPDGVFDTNINKNAAAGDDIGTRIR